MSSSEETSRGFGLAFTLVKASFLPPSGLALALACGGAVIFTLSDSEAVWFVQSASSLHGEPSPPFGMAVGQRAVGSVALHYARLGPSVCE